MNQLAKIEFVDKGTNQILGGGLIRASEDTLETLRIMFNTVSRFSSIKVTSLGPVSPSSPYADIINRISAA